MNNNIKKLSSIGMASKIILLSFLLSIGNAYSQNDVWFFGTGNHGIDFSSGTATAKNGVSGIVIAESITVVGDGSGNVLWYSDGKDVYDGSYTMMPAGNITGAIGNSGAQAAISIKKPGSSDIYYLFTGRDLDVGSNGFRWHEIDMSAAGNGTVGSPLGNVTSSENLISAAAGEMMSATSICGDTVWVVAHNGGTGFNAVPVTSSGVGAPILTTIGPSLATTRGTMAFNSDGSSFVITGAPSTRKYDFNTTTGVVSNESVITATLTYGSEWSPNDDVIYFTATPGSSNLYHYNVATTAWNSISTGAMYGELVKADDGKIYASKHLNTSLATISSPNSTTATAVGIGLAVSGWPSTNWTTLGLPQCFSCSAVVCPDTSITQPSDVCVGSVEDLSAHETGVAGSWSITSTPAGVNPAVITGDDFDASSVNTDPGSYSVTFTLDAPVGGCPSSASRVIVVDSMPVVDLGNDTSICTSASLTLDAGAGYGYAWTPGAEITQTISVSTANTFGVTITDGNGCTGTDNITVSIDTLPVVDLGNDTSICTSASLTLDAGAGYGYAWTPGAEITQTISVSTANTFGVTITDGNGCIGTDNITVSLDTLPIVDLGNDTSICTSASLTLDAGAGYGYAWTPGAEITQTISVSTANTFGVTITDGNGCTGTDNITVSLDTLPVVDLGNDTSICTSANLTLDAGAGYGYAWTPGAEITQTISVNTANTFGVTITDGNGCTGTDNITVSLDALPTVDLGNDTSICINDSINFDAGAGFSYAWTPNSETTQTIEAKLAGIYGVVITDGNGCTGSDSITLSLDTLPVVDLGNDTSICADANITFDAGAGFSYAWIPGSATTQTINVNSANSYSVIITDGEGCRGVDTVVLGIDTLPVVNLGNDTSICTAASLTLDAGAGYGYAWTPGADITQTISVNTANTFGVTITDGNGCTGSDNITVSLDALPTVDLGNDTSICINDSIDFDARAGFSYAWTPNSETSQTIEAKLAGIYGVVITDGNGCTGSDSITLSLDTLPVVDLGNDTSICADANITFDAGAGYSYAWMPSSVTTQTINVNSANSYSVIITDGEGCRGVDTVVLSIDSLPVIDLGNDTSICLGDSITFDAGTGYTYSWTPGSETTQTINVKVANTYGVTVVDGNGCVDSDNITLSIIALPVVDLGNDTSICINDSIEFDAGAGYSYAWTPNSETTQTIEVKTAGTYGVVITAGSGCSASDSIDLSIDSLPIVDLGNDTSICIDTNITFDAGAGYTYLWGPNNQATQTINVNTANTYNVSITDGNGCIGVDTIILSIDSLPIVDLGNDTSICMNDSIVFDAGSGYTYIWGPDGETSDTIKVKAANTYNVSITDGNGCVGVDTIVLSLDTLPIPNLGNDTSICADANISFDAGPYESFDWVTIGNVGTQTISVDSAWTYGVIVTDGNGCRGYDQINLATDSLPIIDLGNDTSICIDSTLTLDANTGMSWVWNNTDVTQTTTVNTTGDYSVVVTDGNGCIGRDTMSLIINALPIVSLGNDTAICSDSLVTFNAGHSTGSWLWNTGDLTQSLSVDSAASYSVIVTDTNGCVGYDTLVLAIDTLPIVNLGNDTSICFDSTLVLDAGNSGAGSYLWNTTESSKSITVNLTDTYYVAVQTTKGCVGYDTIDVSINALPTPDLGIDSSLCAGDSMILYTGLSNVTYLWSSDGSSLDSLIVNSANDYIVTVTDTNNCVGYDTVKVTVDVLPIVDLGIDSSLCAGDSMLIDAGNSGASFSWNNGATSQTITIDSAYSYSVTVTNPANCFASDTVEVTVDSLPEVNLGIDTMICIGDSIFFDANNAGANYAWSNGSNSQIIKATLAGSYHVTVTNSFACIGRDTIDLGLHGLPIINLGGNGEICDGDTMVLDASNTTATYTWSPDGQTTQTINALTAGKYTVAVTDTNGCIDSASYQLVVNALPVIDLGNDTTICVENNYVLDPGNIGVDYVWSNGDATQTTTTSGQGQYWVRVEDAKMCFDTGYIQIDTFAIPEVVLNAIDSSLCLGDSMILDAGAWDTYLWSTNETSQTILVNTADVYSLSITDANGCLGYDTATVTVDDLPNVDLGADRQVCQYLAIDIEVPEEFASYLWNPTSETTKLISTNQPGTYYVDVIDTNHCRNSDTILIYPGPNLIVDLGADQVICSGTDTELEADVSNSVGNLTYAWSTSETTETIIVEDEATYSVLVIDEDGCWGDSSLFVSVHGLPTIELKPDTMSMCDLEVAMEESDIRTVLTGLDIDYVEWGDGSIGNDYHFTQSGFYEATVVDDYGCTGYDSITIASYCRPIDITLPNLFTPNGDGVNDAFIPLELNWEDKDYMMANVEYINFVVYNRWGQVMFSSTGVLPRWFGFNGEGKECSEGMYFWIVDYKDIDGGVYKTNGYVKLKR